MFTCEVDGQPAGFVLRPLAELGFTVDRLGDGLGQWLSAGDPAVNVDPASTISPTRSEIPFGAVCIVGGTIRFTVRWGDATFYVGLDGSLTSPEDFSDLVAFAKWDIQVAGVGDEMFTVYTSDLPGVTEPR